ncbi:biopolymer transporter ExbB [Achromatium sp. WMS2]|nr:biopolymer transporter ExbB [Achromatium sp. WMS2]
MLHLIRAGGLVMLPIIACSIIALAIILEKLWVLRRKRVAPPNLAEQVWLWYRENQITPERIRLLQQGSPLGRILAAGLNNRHQNREVVKEIILETGRQVVGSLDRYLNALGTIAAISPLLGLLGTVTGMIQAFNIITVTGVGNPTLLAGGIGEALITTAAGLIVAIPSLVFHRYLNGLVDRLALDMEAQALKLVEIIQGERKAVNNDQF